MDKNQLDNAIRCGQEFLASYAGPKAGTRPYQLLERLFENATRRTGPDTFEFTWKDIAEPADHEDEGKQLKRNLSTAIQRWAGHTDALSELAIDSGSSCIPVIEQLTQGAGAGIMNRYIIRTAPARSDLQCDKADIPAGYIRYTLEMVDGPNWVGRLVNGLAAKGWVWRSMIGTIVAAVTCACFMIYLGLLALVLEKTAFGLIKALIDVLIVLAALYFTFSPLYYCVTRRIIKASFLMTPLDLQSTQLEYVETGQKHSSGRPIRQFRLVSYSATCQLCKARVEIENGRWRMWGRLVGRCDYNPQEHVYSFDYTTRLGRLIYPEYIMLADTGYCSKINDEKLPSASSANDTNFRDSQGLTAEGCVADVQNGG
ncbi:hypothetical protein GCM10011348_04900 [Marinobacterium nitratireducens]|uniref:Transmembrane protein n=1 Tax=Marinobacterium nitratireducens TaxID=518897 RepID=A0A918DPD3_9GAMM|nr:hypothetical protein [Marinobacterium nitratireducens]GGO76808.1 hypothetical protein GCM10011348_04900 [Marinobacterium nitratireducens]